MKSYLVVANLFKALAHPIRLQILQVLLEEGEACVCHMEARLDQRQAYISQHLAKLREVGLVEDRREGLNVFYALSLGGINDLLEEARKVGVEAARADGVNLRFEPIRKVSPQQCSCPKCEEKIGLKAASA
ncbi:MAG: metalloregulator ArsR/SmtB family transcription factor [Anaerolineales bacterium]|nr:metalloregulator ArsR/SmtB family transcription factor [Anaerolineales bacterium]